MLHPIDMFVDVWFLFEICLAFGTGTYIEGRYVGNRERGGGERDSL